MVTRGGYFVRPPFLYPNYHVAAVPDGRRYFAQYLCGPAGNMPAQMEEAAVNAIATAGKMSTEDAQAMITEWKIIGRYNVEVW